MLRRLSKFLVNFRVTDLELREKWLRLPDVIRQKTFRRGSEPWQSFEVLVELRNYIVHLRRQAPSRKVKAFLKANFEEKIDSKIAEWACETMTAMFAKLTELVEPPKVWIGLNWIWTTQLTSEKV
jgi:hypothetical protein